MNIPFLTPLFKKKPRSLSVPDSILFKELKAVADSTQLTLYKDITIYHHAQQYTIPLMLLDTKRGIYLFESKEWSYDDLKNATIKKAKNQSASEDTLSYQNTQDIIDKKFNEVTHRNSVPIFNYLLMENLNADEYEHLNDSFKKLLPKDRVIFNDTSPTEIIQKLQNAKISTSPLPSKENIIGSLLFQYTIIKPDTTLKLCTPEEIQFIDSEINGFEVLKATLNKDKSSVLLLKVILERLKKPKEKYIIIKPTLLACDILKKELLDIVEHAIIEIDLTAIMILTPLELINMHLKKLHKEAIAGELYIDDILMRKSFHCADLILCDDSNLMPDNFAQYLLHIQKKSNLVLVNSTLKEPLYTFNSTDIKNPLNVVFHQSNPHAKALQLISKLLQTSDAKDIIIVSSISSKEKLHEDLEFFIKDKAVLLNSSDNLINQNLDSLLLLTYSDTNALEAKHLILLDIPTASLGELEYAFSIAKNSIHIVFEESSQEIEELRIKYESNNE